MPSLGPGKDLTIEKIVEAAEANDWHFVNTARALGFKGRGPGTLRRLIKEKYGSWVQLAQRHDALAARERRLQESAKLPRSEPEFVALAKAHNYNQVAMCKSVGASTHAAWQRIHRWGYQNWGDFCDRNGRPRRQLSVARICEAGDKVGWTVSKIQTELGFAQSGNAVKNWIIRNTPFASYGELRDAYRSGALVPDADPMLTPVVGEQFTFNLGPSDDPLVELARSKGWHPDMVCWELDIPDRRQLDAYLKDKGFKNWQTFVEAFR